MREIISLNRKWAFSKMAAGVPEAIDNKWDIVNVPHSWNAIDGQDGDNDYYRGTAYYAKTLSNTNLPKADRYYLEIQGANSSADVYMDGKKLAHHDGGYSTWRVDITEHLGVNSLLVIAVDNSANETVYPQMADFTFYGGLYRNVNLICVNESHFDLDYYGGPGIKVTPVVDGSNANVEVDNEIKGAIKKGFLLFLGVSGSDTKEIADKMIEKVSKLRIFEDENGKTNLGINDVDGEVLLISQFTLYADCRKGNRPSFINAGAPDMAEEMYEYVLKRCRELFKNTESGVFGADMKVSLVNDGPFTILLDSDQIC